jgi:hypothetical protein
MLREIKDHSPSQYPQERDCTLFLSFDEWAEVEGHPWIREASKEEIEAARERRALGDARDGGRDDAKDSEDWQELFTDHTGRPYMLVTVLRTAPGHIWRQASGHLRLMRFRDDG